MFYFYQNQEIITFFVGRSKCDKETVNFFRLYVRREPVKFRVNQRRGCSTITRLFQVVSVVEELSYRQIIC